SLSASILAFVGAVNPFLLITVSYSAGFMLFVIKWLFEGKNPLTVMRNIPLYMYLVPLGGIFLHDLTWILSIQHAPQEEATLVIYQWPILIVLFTALFNRRMPAVSTMLGCLLGFIGVALLIVSKYDSFSAIQLQSGHFFALICALSWSIF